MKVLFIAIIVLPLEYVCKLGCRHDGRVRTVPVALVVHIVVEGVLPLQCEVISRRVSGMVVMGKGMQTVACTAERHMHGRQGHLLEVIYRVPQPCVGVCVIGLYSTHSRAGKRKRR